MSAFVALCEHCNSCRVKYVLVTIVMFYMIIYNQLITSSQIKYVFHPVPLGPFSPIDPGGPFRPGNPLAPECPGKPFSPGEPGAPGGPGGPGNPAMPDSGLVRLAAS